MFTANVINGGIYLLPETLILIHWLDLGPAYSELFHESYFNHKLSF